MQRRTFTIGFSALVTAILSGCGGGGSDEALANPAFPAWNHGGTIALGMGNIIITFDLSQGHLLGLATMDVLDPKKDDPTRRIMPSEVKEVVFASATLGGPETSPARAPWNASGVITLPNAAGSDGAGYFFVVLLTGEAIPFAMSPDKSRYTVTGTSNVVVSSDGSLTYGNYHLGNLSFPSPKVARIHFGADVLGGLSGFARPIDVAYGQWNSDTTGWLENGTIRAPVQIDSAGDAYVDFLGMPNNDQGTFTFHLKTGGVLWFDAKSPRFESLGGMELVDVTGGVHLRYGGYRQGRITHPSADVLRVEFGVDVLHSLADDATGKAVWPTLTDVAYFQWVSLLTHWYDSPAKGVPTAQSNGDYAVDIRGVPNNDSGYIKVFLRDGRRLSLNTLSPRFAGSDPAGITLL